MKEFFISRFLKRQVSLTYSRTFRIHLERHFKLVLELEVALFPVPGLLYNMLQSPVWGRQHKSFLL